jgi:nicotinamide-nucleotide amidase
MTANVEATGPTVDAIARLAGRGRLQVAVAESLTSGQVATALGAGPDASTWFAGGVVAYTPDVKFEVLAVTPGPVVTERCAREMALGVATLLRADATVALTGVGGPEPDEGEPAGTVYLATCVHGEIDCTRVDLDGDPEQVVEAATASALEHLLERLERLDSSVEAGSDGPSVPQVTGSGIRR